MFITRLLAPALALLATSTATSVVTPVPTERRLNVTAVSAEYGHSTLECWEVDTPYFVSDDPATIGARMANLGNVSTLSWTVAPAGQYVGPHHAPNNQWVVLIQGFGEIGLVNDNSTSAFVTPGNSGLIFAADTPDVSSDGHTSRYLGNTESVYLQIPTLDGMIPEHDILHMGPCDTEELTG
ncbi:hypothetical protein FQN54_002874 [Arachnomyces sp. PD_36]|nr:hypothetical protein FQN54_002874 [Arachnomyces sp. PD_36]